MDFFLNPNGLQFGQTYIVDIWNIYIWETVLNWWKGNKAGLAALFARELF